MHTCSMRPPILLTGTTVSPSYFLPYIFSALLFVPGLKRGRPLYLDKHRYTALKRLYLTHRIALEVSAIRSSSDRVIRENFY